MDSNLGSSLYSVYAVLSDGKSLPLCCQSLPLRHRQLEREMITVARFTVREKTFKQPTVIEHNYKRKRNFTSCTVPVFVRPIFVSCIKPSLTRNTELPLIYAGKGTDKINANTHLISSPCSSFSPGFCFLFPF